MSARVFGNSNAQLKLLKLLRRTVRSRKNAPAGVGVSVPASASSSEVINLPDASVQNKLLAYLVVDTVGSCTVLLRLCRSQ